MLQDRQKDEEVSTCSLSACLIQLALPWIRGLGLCALENPQDGGLSTWVG